MLTATGKLMLDLNAYLALIERERARRPAEAALADEIHRLRAEVQHLLQFVYQKCPECGIIVAPDPAHRDGSPDA